MDKKQYLQQLRDRMNEQVRQNESKLENFRKAIVPADLRAALMEIPFIMEPDAVSKALDIIRDKRQDPAIRILALQKIVNAQPPELIDICLQLLQDRNDAPALRVAALNTLRGLKFASGRLKELRADYMAALRSLVDDPNVQLRAMAIEELAISKDEYVQIRLLEELKNNTSNLVPRAKAIQLLGYDIHAGHYPIVKDILQSDDANETEKIEAIHVLANDPSSKELLVNLMTDKKQAKEIRLSSASALQASDPQTFVNVAKRIVMDDKEDKDLKVVTLNGIMHHVDTGVMEHDPDFIKHVSTIKMHTLSPALKKAAKRYVDFIKKRNSKK